MHLTDTRVQQETDGWKVEFVGDDGDSVSVHVAEAQARNETEAMQHARAIMVELTAFGTRGGGRSLNRYDAESNGNFDEDEPFPSTKH
ncbi:hypothetical protein [Agrobacterium tumefaciens]|uniref:hypothetical protein n=1 Tax=Agrobacterium tumefaciens TaxID=358 RepID=UPI0021CF4612|nr:hypothetical protein [Agrobacterium tumefaciens]UXS05396.1 hypothetical protein FY156_27960 [Agrobacterium tumefaciens]